MKTNTVGQGGNVVNVKSPNTHALIAPLDAVAHAVHKLLAVPPSSLHAVPLTLTHTLL
jgi:hypothetical protein